MSGDDTEDRERDRDFAKSRIEVGRRQARDREQAGEFE